MPKATIRGITLYYEERGSGPPVLYVHGAGDYSAFFVRVATETASRFRSIVYDRRGFAGSAGSLAADVAEHVEDAAALLRQLDAAPATIVGSSAGGVVALGLASTYPDLVSGLVLLEPAYQALPALSSSAFGAFSAMYFRRWLLRNEEQAAVELYRWITAYRTGGNQFDSAPEDRRRTAAMHAPAALREVTQLIRPWPSARALGSIACPVTLLIGDLSQRFFHRTSDRVRRALPSCRVVRVEKTAHLIAVDQPGAVVNAVVDMDRRSLTRELRDEGT